MNGVARLVKYVLLAVLLFAVVGALLVVAVFQGLLSPFGIERSTSDDQVVMAVERTQEVSLLSLAVQGIKTEERNQTAFGVAIPGSAETVLLQYQFRAKLGFDGADVQIETTGKSEYLISVPEFTFIGYDEPEFEVAANDGGVLSFVTPDVDPVEMVNQVLNGPAQEKYIADNEQLLRDQTQQFYGALVNSIDDGADVTFEFSP